VEQSPRVELNFFSRDAVCFTQVEVQDCKYLKLSCRGHGECPSDDSVKEETWRMNSFSS
jgi:hypothetical protein